MKFKIFVFSLIFILVSNPSMTWAKSQSPNLVTIGFTPGDDPEWLKKNGIELAKVLQSKLGVSFNIYISKNYSGLVEAMKEKKVDFGFFSALTFVDAEQKAGAKVLLKKIWEGPFYYSAVVTLKKNKIDSIEGLKGKRFGYVDERSTSGYFYPMAMLMKKNIDPDKFFSSTKFYGTHEATVKALLKGDVDAIAVYSDDNKGKSGAWVKFAGDKKLDFQVLWMSEPIPNDPFCVRQDFYDTYPHFTHDLMFALIDLRDEPREKNILKSLYGINGLDLATSRQYDSVRELVKYLNVKAGH